MQQQVVHMCGVAKPVLLQALGLALLETILAALTEGSREKTEQEALQRLVSTVFRRDMSAFRCTDPAWPQSMVMVGAPRERSSISMTLLTCCPSTTADHVHSLETVLGTLAPYPCICADTHEPP